MSDDAYAEPFDAVAFEAAVMVTCLRQAFAVALTPDAARESARLLVIAADAAERRLPPIKAF